MTKFFINDHKRLNLHEEGSGGVVVVEVVECVVVDVDVVVVVGPVYIK